jgi:hypothetical protein
MMHTIIDKKASNWVDRGEAPNATLRRVLARYFDRREPEDAAWLEEQALTVLGMVAADATEVHIAGFLRSITSDAAPLAPYQDDATAETREPSWNELRGSAHARATGIALWHVAKAALVRDLAERVFRGEIPPIDATPDSLGHWIAGRLLSAEELARFEQHGDGNDDRV